MNSNSPTITFRIPKLWIAALDKRVQEANKGVKADLHINRSQYILLAISEKMERDHLATVQARKEGAEPETPKKAKKPKAK